MGVELFEKTSSAGPRSARKGSYRWRVGDLTAKVRSEGRD